MNNQQRGRLGEDQAASLLEKYGYTIIDRNVRSGRWGELDLICMESGDLVFVEVKTRRGNSFGNAIEAISIGKKQRLLRAAQHYKLTHPHTPESMRFDVVTVQLTEHGVIEEIQLYKNIDHG